MHLIEGIKKMLKELISEIGEPTEGAIRDSFTEFSISVNTREFPDINNEFVESILSQVIDDDLVELSLSVDNGEPNVLYNRNSIEEFILRVSQQRNRWEPVEEVAIRLTVNKRWSSGKVLIYDQESFSQFLQNLSLIQILDFLSDQLRHHNPISFYSDLHSFQRDSAVLSVGSTADDDTVQTSYGRMLQNCHFANSSKYMFSPDSFQYHSAETNYLHALADRLKHLFSLIYLSNYSRIDKEGIHVLISGYKTLSEDIPLHEDLNPIGETLYSLYAWCYHDTASISDKLGLTQNLIPIHLDQTNSILHMKDTVIDSVKSAHRTYLKENVSKYISIRSRIQEELSWISDKTSEIVAEYLSNYQKSIFVYISFFASVLILRVLNTGNFENTFTREPTLLALGFLVLSLIFLVFSSFNLNSEKKRLTRKYDNLKKRYYDLLVKEDIDKILRNDSEFNYEIRFVEKRHNSLLILWIITLIALIVILDFIIGLFFSTTLA